MSNDVQRNAAKCNPVEAGPSALRILRLPAVMDRVGLSRSSIYNRIRSGAFPRAVHLGGRAVGFVDHEIAEWVDQAITRRHAVR